MFGANVWRRVLGVDRATVIEDDRLRRGVRNRGCPCAPETGRPSADVGAAACGLPAMTREKVGATGGRSISARMQCFLQADSPRVNCPEHGPTVAQVPWARHGAGHTRIFDDQVAWLVTHTAKSTVCELMRIAWRSVGSIIDRVVADGRAAHDPFDGLTRIGHRRDLLQEAATAT